MSLASFKCLKIAILLLSFTLVFSCGLTGEEVGRLKINALSKTEDQLIIKEEHVSLKKGDELGVWSEMDYKYEGELALRFKVEVLKNGEPFGAFEIDPTDKNITFKEMKSSFNGKTDWSFTGKNTTIPIKEDGDYTFKGILVASENPTLEINKAELVIKK